MVTSGPAPQPIKTLDELPSPFRMGLTPEPRGFLLYESSRGCPYRCDFCLSGGDPLREHTLERVFADLDAIAATGVAQVRFLDRTFNTHDDRALAILAYLARRHPHLGVHVEIEPNRLTPAVAAALDRAEMHVEIGIQSLDAAVLRNVHRATATPEARIRVRQLCGQSRGAVHLDLVAGLPGGTLPGLLADLHELTAWAPRHIQVELLKILPGTGLASRLDELGIACDTDAPYAVRRTPTMPTADLRAAAVLSRLTDFYYNDRHLGPVVRAADHVWGGAGFWSALLDGWQRGRLPKIGRAHV
jgi:radical SAM superfamily enzyme YgiQ (UPF0313 family)